VEDAHAEVLLDTVGIAFVALWTSTRREPGHCEFLDVRSQRLVEPSTLQPLLEDRSFVPGNHPNRFDQGLAVDLGLKVLELSAPLGNDRQRPARCVYVDPDVPSSSRGLVSLLADAMTP
jgi:hypothetical protein